MLIQFLSMSKTRKFHVCVLGMENGNVSSSTGSESAILEGIMQVLKSTAELTENTAQWKDSKHKMQYIQCIVEHNSKPTYILAKIPLAIVMLATGLLISRAKLTVSSKIKHKTLAYRCIWLYNTFCVSNLIHGVAFCVTV